MTVLDSVVMFCKNVCKTVGLRYKFASSYEIWNKRGYKIILHIKTCYKHNEVRNTHIIYKKLHCSES